MIRYLFVLVSVSGGSHIFFPFPPCPVFFYPSVCLVELVSDVYKPDPCPFSTQAQFQKHVKMGAPGMGWDGMQHLRLIHPLSLLPMFSYLGCGIIAGHHRISAGRWATSLKGPPGGQGERGSVFFGRLQSDSDFNDGIFLNLMMPRD